MQKKKKLCLPGCYPVFKAVVCIGTHTHLHTHTHTRTAGVKAHLCNMVTYSGLVAQPVILALNQESGRGGLALRPWVCVCICASHKFNRSTVKLGYLRIFNRDEAFSFD